MWAQTYLKTNPKCTQTNVSEQYILNHYKDLFDNQPVWETSRRVQDEAKERLQASRTVL